MDLVPGRNQKLEAYYDPGLIRSSFSPRQSVGGAIGARLGRGGGCLSPPWKPDGGDARADKGCTPNKVMVFGPILRAVFQITLSVICMCEGNHLQQSHCL